MWDVKTSYYGTNYLLVDCFTLTMWDVKSTASLDEAHIVEFYLNYVGCKV